MLAFIGLLFIGDFIAPSPPPRAEYRIQLKIDLDRNVISGTQEVRMKNTARRPLSRLAVLWSTAPGNALRCEFEGRQLTPLNDKSPLVFQLPREWSRGA